MQLLLNSLRQYGVAFTPLSPGLGGHIVQDNTGTGRVVAGQPQQGLNPRIGRQFLTNLPGQQPRLS